jgi:Flp pilus assembly protein TadG
MAVIRSARSRRHASRRLRKRLWRDERGQDLVEFVLTMPVLLVMVFGILEFGTLLDIGHSLSVVSREGANIASRGASLDSVLLVTMSTGATWNLGSAGTVVATELTVQGGVTMVVDQRTGGGLGATSRLGNPGGPAQAYQAQGLLNAQTYYVVEVFLPYQPFTPLKNLVSGLVPDTLYDRTLF